MNSNLLRRVVGVELLCIVLGYCLVFLERCVRVELEAILLKFGKFRGSNLCLHVAEIDLGVLVVARVLSTIFKKFQFIFTFLEPGMRAPTMLIFAT